MKTKLLKKIRRNFILEKSLLINKNNPNPKRFTYKVTNKTIFKIRFFETKEDAFTYIIFCARTYYRLKKSKNKNEIINLIIE